MRPIDADALTKKLKNHHDFYVEAYGGFNNLPMKEKARVDEITGCIASVRNIPTLTLDDLLPHGRWDSVKNPQWPAYSHDKCNLCGWWNTRNAMCYDGNHKPGHRLNYCPNCGAKMDGSEDQIER